MTFETFNLIRVSLPKEGHSKKDLLQQVVALLQRSAPIGVMGNYAAVYEMNDSTEGFTPLEGANPTLGASGKNETCNASMFTTYAPVGTPEPVLEKFLTELSAIHPWEHPVIEVFPARLWGKP